MRKWTFLYLFFLMSSLASAMNSPKYHFIHLKASDRQDRNAIANIIHIDQIIDDSAYSVVSEHDFQLLTRKIPHLIRQSHIIDPSSYSINNSNASKDKKKGGEIGKDIIDFPDQDSAYHTYQEMVAKLQELHQHYPQITELSTIGQGHQGLKIWNMRISLKKETSSKTFVPGILFIGAHHAREHLSTEVPLKLLEYLLQNHKEEHINKLLSNRDIYFVPMLNPDGAMYDIQGKRYKLWRKNRGLNHDQTYGVDLNRNYGHGWGTGGSSDSPNSDVYMGSEPFSEPETKAVREFIQHHENIRIILSFHTFSELILYPWGGKYDGVGGEDEVIFKQMAQTMANWNNYKPEQSSDLYIASGDTCDWAYGEHAIYCFTFELSPKNSWLGGGGFYPGVAAINKAFQANLRPALYLIEYADDPRRVLQNSPRNFFD